MDISEKSLLKRIINNVDLIYLIITALSIIISLFFDYEAAITIGALFAVLGVFFLPLTVGAKMVGFNADERASQILGKAVSAAFSITLTITTALGILWSHGIVHFGYDLTNIIVVIGYLSENIFICVFRRLF